LTGPVKVSAELLELRLTEPLERVTVPMEIPLWLLHVSPSSRTSPGVWFRYFRPRA
jgi:hypothetical protein